MTEGWLLQCLREEARAQGNTQLEQLVAAVVSPGDVGGDVGVQPKPPPEQKPLVKLESASQAFLAASRRSEKAIEKATRLAELLKD